MSGLLKMTRIIYEVKVIISNNDESITRTEQIRVLTLVAPLVTILNPKDSEFIVQYQNTKVKAEVLHPLGIYQTELIVNDSLHIAVISGNGADIYEFNWQADVPSHVGDRLADAPETLQDHGVVHFDLVDCFGGIHYRNQAIDQAKQCDYPKGAAHQLEN